MQADPRRKPSPPTAAERLAQRQDELAHLLGFGRSVIDPLTESDRPPLAVERLALRLDEIARALGVSRRSLERERSAGRFPKPDLIIGRRMPLWRPDTIREWLERGGR
jgi:predicted DNA-binding transcriptional regulator AlpA